MTIDDYANDILAVLRAPGLISETLESHRLVPRGDPSLNGHSNEDRLGTLLRLHADLNINEQMEGADAVRAVADHFVQDMRHTADRGHDAMKIIAASVRDELAREIEKASPRELVALQIIRASEFGNGAMHIQFDRGRVGPLIISVGLRKSLPAGHRLLMAVAESECYLPNSDGHVFVLGECSPKPWYHEQEVLRLTAAWHRRQQAEWDERGRRDRLDEEARQNAHRQTDAYRLAQAERKIAEMEKLLAEKGKGT